MSIPFNPQRPRDSALNAVMLGVMGTGKGKIIIDFETGGDQIFTDGQGIPGFESLLKAEVQGSSSIEQLNGEGKWVRVAATPVWFSGQVDLRNLKQNETWKVDFDVSIDSVGAGSADLFATEGILRTVGIGPIARPDGVVLMNLAIDRSIRFFYFNLSGTQTLLSQSAASFYTFGTKVHCFVERTLTDYIFMFDEQGTPFTDDVPISSVIERQKDFPQFGTINSSSSSATARFDNISW